MVCAVINFKTNICVEPQFTEVHYQTLKIFMVLT